MPSALSWKPLKSVNVTTMSDVGYITALKSLFDATTYADGSSRSGSPTAWTTSTLSDGSLKLTATSHPLGLIAHFVPASLAGSFPKSFGETIYGTAGKVLGTIVLNPGSYDSATPATPWGASARCFGYCHMSPVKITPTGTATLNQYAVVPTDAEINTSGISAGNFTSLKIKAWESADALVIQVSANTDRASVYVLGGWLAPVEAIAEPADSETDGVLYGIITSGNNVAANNGTIYSAIQYWNSQFTSFGVDNATLPSTAYNYNDYTSFMHNSLYRASGYTTNMRLVHPHCGVFMPGTTSVIIANKQGGIRTTSNADFNRAGFSYVQYGPDATRLNTSSGNLIKMPLLFQSPDYFLGRAREMFAYPCSYPVAERPNFSVRFNDGEEGAVLVFNNYFKVSEGLFLKL